MNISSEIIKTNGSKIINIEIEIKISKILIILFFILFNSYKTNQTSCNQILNIQTRETNIQIQGRFIGKASQNRKMLL